MYVYNAAKYGQLDCIKYLVEEAKAPLDNWLCVALARYYEHTDCLNYLLEKGCPEPTDEEYAKVVEQKNEKNWASKREREKERKKERERLHHRVRAACA